MNAWRSVSPWTNIYCYCLYLFKILLKMNINLFLLFSHILFSSMYESRVLIPLVEFMCLSKMLYILKLPTCMLFYLSGIWTCTRWRPDWSVLKNDNECSAKDFISFTKQSWGYWRNKSDITRWGKWGRTESLWQSLQFLLSLVGDAFPLISNLIICRWSLKWVMLLAFFSFQCRQLIVWPISSKHTRTLSHHSSASLRHA